MEAATRLRKMEKGARHRSNAEKNHPAGGESQAGPGADSGGGGVALKKEIGLVSACGIIVGESWPCSLPLGTLSGVRRGVNASKAPVCLSLITHLHGSSLKSAGSGLCLTSVPPNRVARLCAWKGKNAGHPDLADRASQQGPGAC